MMKKKAPPGGADPVRAQPRRGRPRVRVAPDWFKLQIYEGVRNMDAADWYVNLSYRISASREGSSLAPAFARGERTVIRRSNTQPVEFAFSAVELPNSFRDIIEGRVPKLGVTSLSA